MNILSSKKKRYWIVCLGVILLIDVGLFFWLWVPQLAGESMQSEISRVAPTGDFRVPDELMRLIKQAADTHQVEKGAMLFYQASNVERVNDVIATLVNYAEEKTEHPGMVIILISDEASASGSEHAASASQAISIVHWQDQEGQMRLFCTPCGDEGTIILDVETGQPIEKFPYLLGPYTLFDRLSWSPSSPDYSRP